MTEMTEARAREILGDKIRAKELQSVSEPYIAFFGDGTASLEGDFTADELEAIAFWMRKHAT